jgi:TnpA family transposase
MSAANQLTDQQRSVILTDHHAFRRREMVRHWMISEHDREVVNERRHNRLGFAVQLCLLRYPGWPLKPGEIPPSNLLEYVAEQLSVDPEEITEYPKRDRTRRKHVQWLTRTYDFHCYYPPGDHRPQQGRGSPHTETRHPLLPQRLHQRSDRLE